MIEFESTSKVKNVKILIVIIFAFFYFSGPKFVLYNTAYYYYHKMYDNTPPVLQPVILEQNHPISIPIASFWKQQYHINLLLYYETLEVNKRMEKLIPSIKYVYLRAIGMPPLPSTVRPSLSFKINVQDQNGNSIHQEIVETIGRYQMTSGKEKGMAYHQYITTIQLNSGNYTIEITPLSDEEDLKLFNEFHPDINVFFGPLDYHK